VVISRRSEEEPYKFDFVKKVEGNAPTDKEDPFVFSVSPHETCSLTNTGREQENDAFYQRGKVIIKGESMTDIDSALSVLQIGGTSNNLTISNTGALSSLKVGTNNYKLVFLNDVNLVTEHSDAGVY
jgi:P pilus assembly chaperone PapD